MLLSVLLDTVSASCGFLPLRSKYEPSHPLITPMSPHPVHLHSMVGGRSVRKTAMVPSQGWRFGRR